jgi:hypothetical protein
VESLVNASLLVERKSCIDFGRNLARNDLKNLLAELYEEVVQGRVDLSINVLSVLLAVGNGFVDELGVLGLLSRSED